MSTPLLPCGCVDNARLTSPMDGRRYGKCVAHAAPRLPTGGRLNPLTHDSYKGPWYVAECCPFCGRANPGGYCCPHTLAECETCGLATCGSIGMGHYHLEGDHDLICRATIPVFSKSGKGRTVAARAKLATLTAHPEREATPERVRVLFLGGGL